LDPVYEFKDDKSNVKSVLNKIDVKKKSFSNLNNKIDYSLKVDDIEIGKRMFLCPNLKREPKEIHNPNNKDVEIQRVKSFQTKRHTNPLEP
jgi:histidinol phosphatase-like enzyme